MEMKTEKQKQTVKRMAKQTQMAIAMDFLMG